MVDLPNGLGNLVDAVLTKDASPLYEDPNMQDHPSGRGEYRGLPASVLRTIHEANQRALNGDKHFEKPSDKDMQKAITTAVGTAIRLANTEASLNSIESPSAAPAYQGGALGADHFF